MQQSLASPVVFGAAHAKSGMRVKGSAQAPLLRVSQTGRRAARFASVTTAAYPAKPQGVKPKPMNFGCAPGMYPDPQLIEEALANFPEKGIANQEESLALYCDGGYAMLDVRSPVELEDEGKMPGSYHVPLINAKKKWNLETSEKETIQTANPEFMDIVQMTFPDKSTPIIIFCSDSRQRAIQVLMLMDDAGYTNLVGMKGGYNLMLATFDNKFRRRFVPEVTTSWASDGSTGFHATVAGGFEKMDKGDEGYMAKDTVKWIDWKESVGAAAAAPAAAAYEAPAAPAYEAPAAPAYEAPAAPVQQAGQFTFDPPVTEYQW